MREEHTSDESVWGASNNNETKGKNIRSIRPTHPFASSSNRSSEVVGNEQQGVGNIDFFVRSCLTR